jgi:hypothetical protein
VDAEAELAQRLGRSRNWVSADPRRGRRKAFRVCEGAFVSDPTVTGPRTRKEVFAPLPEAPQFNGARPGLYEHTRLMDYIRGLAPLERHLDVHALEYLDGLENALILQDGLTKSERAKIRIRLHKLRAPRRSLWEEWIDQGHITTNKIDRIVRGWLAAEVQVSEKALFHPGWERIPYAHNAAGDYFAALPDFVLSGLGIKIIAARDMTHGYRTAQLSRAVSATNDLAQRIGSGIRFKS